MNVYRVTQVDPLGRRYPYQPGTPRVRVGTKRQASAIARQVRQDNDTRQRSAERWPDLFPYQPIVLTVERAPVGEFTDITAEFLGEGE